MKFIRWTEEAIREAAKNSTNNRDFHHRFRGAEKAAKRLGILESLFPKKQEHNKPYTEAQIRAAAAGFTKRSELQRHNPSLYNAARALGLINTLFPVKLNARISFEELKERASRYASRSEFEAKDSRGYQIAQKRRILDDICPPAIQGFSRAEKDILAFLQTLSPDFMPKRFLNDFAIDCYSESLKLGIEYNGLYWHSEEGGKHRGYHLKKTKYFEGLGIRIIHIWEHEWRDRKSQVKNYLTSATAANSTKIGARKCTFKRIEAQIARQFLNEQHIQGAPRSIKLALGCFHNNTLVSVSTFGPHHRKGEQEMVLSRFACLPSHTVVGGLAKMTKMAFDLLGPLKSWADYCKSQARGYLAAGWTIEKVLSPDYFYASPTGEHISKQSRIKSKVKTPQGLTERQHASQDGLYRIWDCGKIVLVYRA